MIHAIKKSAAGIFFKFAASKFSTVLEIIQTTSYIPMKSGRIYRDMNPIGSIANFYSIGNKYQADTYSPLDGASRWKMAIFSFLAIIWWKMWILTFCKNGHPARNILHNVWKCHPNPISHLRDMVSDTWKMAKNGKFLEFFGHKLVKNMNFDIL